MRPGNVVHFRTKAYCLAAMVTLEHKDKKLNLLVFKALTSDSDKKTPVIVKQRIHYGLNVDHWHYTSECHQYTPK